MALHRINLPATPQAVGRIRTAVAELAEDGGLTDLWAVRYCISEAVTNVALHAYGQAGGHVEVVAEISKPGTLRVLVKDDGVGFQLRSDSPGLGLGVAMIAKLASRVDVQSPPGGGTVLFMEFVDSEMRSRDRVARLIPNQR